MSDADPELERALRDAGWHELGRDESLLPLAAPAGAALGRGLASLAPVDALLGGALRVGRLARYASDGAPLVEPRAGRLVRTRAKRLTPLPYTDALGVARVEEATEARAAEAGAAGVRMAAWCAASAGYLAGLSGEALRLALEHAHSRRAFGGPLSALEPVQQMLADAATLTDGLALLSAESPGADSPGADALADALAHAGEAAERVMAICMQVTGALGYTLDFPLQRAYRRSRAARSWADAVLVGLGESGRMTAPELPLDGLRVLDYGQYVASPFATMLLADLGADVVKVEPPGGDEWRRYDPFQDGESRYFYALNRGKRSVALDLKTPEGREHSRALIASADALVHNCLPERARRFGLDPESVRAVNPRCVTVCVSAFGSNGPDSNRPAYDLIGQALSGLLLADPRPGDAVPRRTGGLALADFTAGLLAALAVAAGLLGRRETAPELEVSLLGAALALQAQRFVAVDGIDARVDDGARGEARTFAGRAELDALTRRAESLEALDPYYRAHACSDGFIALACLNTAQRRAGLRAARPRRSVRGEPAGRAGRCRGARAAGRPRPRRGGGLRAPRGPRGRGGTRRAARARERGAEPRPALRGRAGAGERPRSDRGAAGSRPGAPARWCLQGRRHRGRAGPARAGARRARRRAARSPHAPMRAVTDLPRPVRRIDHVWIPLSDGTRLGARIWLPEDAESDPVPAILEYIPYRKGDGTAPRDEPRHAYFAGHGYAALRVDLRGSGESDGLLHDEYLPQEQEDALELLSWIAAQPWCTGAVGMFGISWGGFNGLQVAAHAPPELKAVISLCSTDDRYADDVHYRGGAVLALEMLSWGASMLSFNAVAPDPEVAGPGWREAWLERIDAVEPYEYEWLRHQRRDDYWKQGSVCEDFAAIECPVYAIGGWADGYSEAVFRLVAGLRAPVQGADRPLVARVPRRGGAGPAIGFLGECLRWWDRWLKGEDTGIEDEPALRFWMQEPVAPAPQHRERPGRWVAEESWPSPRDRGTTAPPRRRRAGRRARPGRAPARDLDRPALRARQRRLVRRRQPGRRPRGPARRRRPGAQLHLGAARGADRAARQRARGARAGQRPPGRADRRAALRRGARRQLAARDARRAEPDAPRQPRASGAARARSAPRAWSWSWTASLRRCPPDTGCGSRSPPPTGRGCGRRPSR